MSDRITLIAQIGAQLGEIEKRGDRRTALEESTCAVLRAALEQLVADASLAADADRKKAADRARKAKSAPRIPRNSTESTESAEIRGIEAELGSELQAHITRALDLELQKQDQKQELESPDGLSSGAEPSPGDANGGDDPPEAPPFALSPPDPPGADDWRRFDPDGRLHASATPAAVRAAVNFVLDRYAKAHPRRRPGDKERKLIARHLRTYTPRELAAAIDGNAADEWAVRVGKHELTWIFRDNGQIDHYREKAEKLDGAAERDAATIEETGWLPSEAMR